METKHWIPAAVFAVLGALTSGIVNLLTITAITSGADSADRMVGSVAFVLCLVFASALAWLASRVRAFGIAFGLGLLVTAVVVWFWVAGPLSGPRVFTADQQFVDGMVNGGMFPVSAILGIGLLGIGLTRRRGLRHTKSGLTSDDPSDRAREQTRANVSSRR